MQGGVLAYSGVDPTTPLDVALTQTLNDASANTHTAPSITPVSADTMLMHFWVCGSINQWNNAGADSGTQRFHSVAAAGTVRPILGYDRTGPVAGVPSSAITATLNGGASQAATMQTIALRPASVAPSYNETLRPTSITNLTNLTGAYTDVDQDPDSTITDPGLLGSDPAGQSGLTHGPVWPSALRTAWPGLTGFSWNTPANLQDQSDTTFATAASAATTHGDFFDLPGADLSGIPANATITNVQYQLKHRAGTANRVTIFCQLATSNTALLGTETTIAANLGTTAGGITSNVDATGTLPTVAEAQGATFGIRLRMTRSNTSVYDLYYIRILITYSTPGAAQNTQVDVALGDPTGTLVTGAATGEIRARFRKKGTGSNPLGRIELRNAAGTLLVTAIGDSTITESDADGQLLSAHSISPLSRTRRT